MANHNDLFHSESVNEQVEQLVRIQEPRQQHSTPGASTIAALQSIYKEDEAILERAWARIASAEAATYTRGSRTNIVDIHHYRGESTMRETQFSPETSGSVPSSSPTFVSPSERPYRSHRRQWRMLSQFAAVLTAMLIVGSMLWVINAGQSRKSSTGSSPNTKVQATKPPATSSFAVYVGEEGGLLRADAQTGKVIWKYQLPSTADPYGQIFVSQILPAGKVVYGLMQGFSSTPAQVMAFDAITGKVLWSQISPEARSIALEHNMLYVGVDNANPQVHESYVYVLDISKVTHLPTKYTFNGSYPHLSIVDDVLYVATDMGLSAIDTAHSQQIWQKSLAEMGLSGYYGHTLGFTVAHGTVYATYQDVHSIYLFALRASSGDKLWLTGPINVTGASGGGYGVTAPVAGDSMVYFATFGTSGAVFAYNTQKGTFVWSYKTDTFIQRTPVFSGNTLYIAKDDIGNRFPTTRFTALNGTTGEQIWQTGPAQGTGLPGFVLNGVVYVATANAQTTDITYAFKSSTGAPLWQAELGNSPSTLAGGDTN